MTINIDRADNIAQSFRRIRRLSEQLCEPLQLEDFGLQAMPETSPPKWHLAHTTWFFETFILKPFLPGYEPWHPKFEVLFNSYYNGIGEQFPRPQRGLLSRPSLQEVQDYRHAVDRQVKRLLDDPKHPERDVILARAELGLHHEQQHQELFFTDIKYSLSANPLNPAFAPPAEWQLPGGMVHDLQWHSFDGGVVHIGYDGDGFHYDNETPLHRQFVEPFSLASRLTTNAEYLEFIEDGGYQRPELWLADGWATVQQQQWKAPLYWRQDDGALGDWCEFTLYGLQPLDPARPVSHLSGYEADAFARWSGARLPTEFEWECVAKQLAPGGHFVESAEFHPLANTSEGLQQMFGTLWEWTTSAYSPYPGFSPAEGAIGEYNGKFMCNQWVLRGGSCVTSQDHIRASYRNFFYPRDRWQFTGVRLARS